MKKALKISLLVLLVMILAFIVILGYEEHTFNSDEVKLLKEESYPINNLNKISIDTTIGSIKILKSTDENIKIIQYTNYSKIKKFESKLNGNTLNIDGRNKDCFLCFSEINIFELYIPEEYTNNLFISTTSGSVKTNDNYHFDNLNVYTKSAAMQFSKMETTNINLRSTSGSININEIDSKNIKISTTSGSIKVDSLEADSTTLKSNSGKIKIDEATSNISLKTTSGSIKILSFEGKIKADTTSGSITIKDFNPKADSSFESTSGKINLTMNKKASCTFDFDSVSGSLKQPGKLNEGLYVVKAKTTSGNIIINED